MNSLVIIPAYNESSNIGDVLEAIRELNIPSLDILVVNDGSTDMTETIVKHHNFNIISLPYNMGYGSALQTGFKYAVAMGYDFVIQFDADGQHDPEDIRKIIDAYVKTTPDVVPTINIEAESSELSSSHIPTSHISSPTSIILGSRFLSNTSTYKVGMFKNLAIRLFRYIIKRSTNTIITDPTSGLQGLSKQVFSYYAGMGHYPTNFPDANILIYMLRQGYKIQEIPANIHDRMGGKSMHSGLKPVLYMIKMLISIEIILFKTRKINIKGSGVNDS